MTGKQLRRLRAQEEQVQRGLAESNRQVELLNLQQQRMQEEELRTLSAAEEQRKMARQAAIIKTSTAGLAGVASLAGQGMAASEIVNADPGSFDAAQLQTLGGMYGYQFPAYSQPASGFQPGMQPFYYGQQPYYQPLMGS